MAELYLLLYIFAQIDVIIFADMFQYKYTITNILYIHIYNYMWLFVIIADMFQYITRRASTIRPFSWIDRFLRFLGAIPTAELRILHHSTNHHRPVCSTREYVCWFIKPNNYNYKYQKH